MARRSLKLLIVDDDTDLLELLGMLLAMEGAEVALAESYYKALDRLEENNFDLVVADWRMPKMHGLYLLEMIKDMKPEMPVIIMTAYLSDEIRIEAKKRGVDLLLEKPFEYKDLHAGILRLVKK